MAAAGLITRSHGWQADRQTTYEHGVATILISKETQGSNGGAVRLHVGSWVKFTALFKKARHFLLWLENPN